MTQSLPIMAASPDHRTLLRSATRDAHLAAENRWLPGGCFQNQAHYQAWLHALAETHAHHGQRAADCLGRADRDLESLRCAALVADLGLSARDNAEEYGAQQTQGWAWGVLYALNGSALGAAGLLKSGTVSPQWPIAYLSMMRSYALSGQLKDFFQRLNRATCDTDEMVIGAQTVFHAMSINGPK